MSAEATTEKAEPALSTPQALAAWLDAQGLGVGAPLESKFLSGGSQNEIFEITRGDLHAVLRIPPATANAERDAGIVREYRIIEALDGTDVPHTAAIALCEDRSVLGRTFYLMGFVDGWSPMGLTRDESGRKRWPAPFDSNSDQRRGLSFQLIEGSSTGSRAASSRASTRPPRGCGRTSRWTTSPASCTATTSSPT